LQSKTISLLRDFEPSNASSTSPKSERILCRTGGSKCAKQGEISTLAGDAKGRLDRGGRAVAKTKI
jgi:hypothetical protein